jgi:methyl-accepting chemotaxis protein
LKDVEPHAEFVERPERTLLGGMGFGTRIALFIAIGAAVMLALAYALYDSDRRAAAESARLHVSQRIAETVARIEFGALSLITNERDFVRTRDPRYLTNYQKASAGVHGALEEIRGLETHEPFDKDLATIGDGIAEHARQFEKVVETQKILGANDDTGLARLVRVSADALAAKLADLNAAEMAGRFKTIRQLERGMRAAPNRPQLSRIEAELSVLKAKLSDQQLSAVEKSVIATLIDSYRSDAMQLGRASLGLTREIGRLDEIDKYMAPSLAAIAAHSQRLATANLARMADASGELRLRIGASALAAVLSVILIGWLIMSTMTRPMGRLSEAAVRIVHGDRAAPIPARGNYDAVGELANALAYFRDNLAAADRLRTELEEQIRAEADRHATYAEELDQEAAEIGQEAMDEESATSAADTWRYTMLAPPEDDERKESISALSRRVTRTSQNASVAAHEAESTDLIIRGLVEAAKRVAETDRLVASIKDQTSFLHVETNLRGGGENIVVLAPSLGGADRGADLSAKDRIRKIQDHARLAAGLIQETTQLIGEVKTVAAELAARTSNEAIEAATQLLEQSENLRGMLDHLLDRLSPIESPRGDRDRTT